MGGHQPARRRERPPTPGGDDCPGDHLEPLQLALHRGSAALPRSAWSGRNPRGRHRKLVRHLRSTGAQMGVISTQETDAAALVAKARAAPGMAGQDLATGISVVSRTPGPTGRATRSEKGRAGALPGGSPPCSGLRLRPQEGDDSPAGRPRLSGDGGSRAHLCGGRARSQARRRVPHQRPGRPGRSDGRRSRDCGDARSGAASSASASAPAAARAIGARTFKLKFGHRGANQPVQELKTGKVEITAQNHGFCGGWRQPQVRRRVTHLNLNDGTVEGLELETRPGLQRPVPPGGFTGSARLARPVRSLHPTRRPRGIGAASPRLGGGKS